MSEGGDEEEEHPPSAVGTRCPREFKELFPTTFRTVSSAQYVHFLYWFCSDCPRGQMQKEVGLKTKTFAKLLKRCRDILWLSISKAMGSQKLGGPGRFVAVDETFFVKKKFQRRLPRAANRWEQSYCHGVPRSRLGNQKSNWKLCLGPNSRPEGNHIESAHPRVCGRGFFDLHGQVEVVPVTLKQEQQVRPEVRQP